MAAATTLSCSEVTEESHATLRHDTSWPWWLMVSLCTNIGSCLVLFSLHMIDWKGFKYKHEYGWRREIGYWSDMV